MTRPVAFFLILLAGIAMAGVMVVCSFWLAGT